MRFHFTKHAREKFTLTRRYGFTITQKQIKEIIRSPTRRENRPDGTTVSMSLFDRKHVLRVAHRREGDIIIVITFYPGGRKEYGL